MKSMKKLLTTAILLAATAAPLAAQDIIKFKDPSKNPDMEGEIATMSYKLIEIDIPVGGQLARQPADDRARGHGRRHHRPEGTSDVS